MRLIVFSAAVLIICQVLQPAVGWREVPAVHRRWYRERRRHLSPSPPLLPRKWQPALNQPSNALFVRGGDTSEVKDPMDIPLIPHIEEPEEWAQEKRAVVLMDIFSEYHGFYLSHRAKEAYGAATITVFSDYIRGYFLMTQPDNLPKLMSMCMPCGEAQVDEWRRHVDGLELVALSCESDSGLADAERLGKLLEVTYRDEENDARRNKFLMNQAVEEAGIPVVRQRLCRTVEEAISFAEELGVKDDTTNENEHEPNNPRVVIKPTRGVASDDVFMCDSVDSVREAFATIIESVVFGSPTQKNEAALVQEFAVGQEYAIDIVSKDGEHKVTAIWKYDKRPANGAPFVYFATKLFDGEEESEVICSYIKQCLDALDKRWGLSHNEVILTKDGPRLVEVNCRQHNMDFLPLVMSCIGYNSFDLLLESYLGGKGDSFYPEHSGHPRIPWEAIPDLPSLQRHGAMIHLVNFKEGTLRAVNNEALMEIQSMESVLDLEVYAPFLEIGNEIEPTINIKTDAGWVQLVNEDHASFQRDYDRIVQLMPLLFEVEKRSST